MNENKDMDVNVAGTSAPVVWWRRPRLLAALVAAVAVVGVGLGVGIPALVESHRTQEAHQAWVAVASDMEAARSELGVAVEGAEQAQSAAEGRSIDEALTDALDAALTEARALTAKTPEAPSGREALIEATTALTGEVERIKATTKTLTDATAAVMDVVGEAVVGEYAKSASGAATALDEAKKTLAESAGRVADEAVREALSKRIEEVSSLLEDNAAQSGAGNDWTLIAKAKDRLDEAVKALTDARAKTAEAQEAWQKAEDEKNNAAGGGAGTAPATGYVAPRAGGYAAPSTGGYVAPRTGGGAAPAPSNGGGGSAPAPSGGGSPAPSTGGGNFEWGDEWVPSQTCDTQGNCVDHW